MRIQMVVVRDASGAIFLPLMRIFLEEVLGFHVDWRWLSNSKASEVWTASRVLSVLMDDTYGPNHIGINLVFKSGHLFEYSHQFDAPQQLGDQYYGYREGLFVAKAVIDAAYNDSGMVLEHYKTYGAVSSPKKYFDSLSDFSPSTKLRECWRSDVWNSASAMRNYAQFSGDYEGVELQPNTTNSYKATCHDGHWWIAPSCRGNIPMCIPVLTFDDGLMQAMMQWAAAYGMPFGIANFASRESYENHDPERFRSLFYGSTASDEFSRFSPQPVQLPRHNAGEWLQGNQRTAPDDPVAAHFASHDLKRKAVAVHHFFSKLRIEVWEIESLLVEIHSPLPQLSSVGDERRAVACRWVRENRARWELWKAPNTTCSEGSGVVDAGGGYLPSRVDGVGCETCPSGTRSKAFTDLLGETFQCEPCPMGRYQPKAGSSACEPCLEGTYQDSPGQIACIACNPPKTTRFWYAVTSQECNICAAGLGD